MMFNFLLIELLNIQANIWLGTLLLDRSEDIYRMKGLLSVKGMDERFVFQVRRFLSNIIYVLH